VLAGVSWGMKQQMGVLFLGALVMFVLLCAVTKRRSWTAATKAAVALGAGFVSVIAVVLAFLWWHGALRDWYLQTIAFPRDFYLASTPGNGPESTSWLSRLAGLAVTFVRLQWAAAGYWFVIRLVVIGGGAMAVVRRHRPPDLLLLGLVTAFLWLGTFPSAHFMHQWWTISLTFAPFVACVSAVERAAIDDRLQWGATMVVTIVLVAFGLIERGRAVQVRAAALTETLTEPALFRGIRTTAPVKRVFETFYRSMLQYRSRHPGARVVSIETSDGASTGIPESLLLLSFLEDNPHAAPVYWSLPVLATSTYPHYLPDLSREIAATHPVVVDQHMGAFTPVAIPGYSMELAAPSDFGYWYLYLPDADRAARGGITTFLDANGVQTALPPQNPAAAAAIIDQPNNWNIDGRWRERVPLAAGDGGQPRLTNVYTWPADLSLAHIPPAGAVERVSDRPLMRAAPVTQVSAGAWTVDGRASDRYSYLLRFSEVPLEVGDYFVARGELLEGGLTVGVTRSGHWYALVNIQEPGPFSVAFQIQSPGRFELTVANCIELSWRGRLGVITNMFLTNRFTVARAGWIHSGTPAGAAQ